MTDPAASHRRAAAASPRARSVRCAVLTVSDSRTAETDESGGLIEQRLGAAGHVVADRRIVPDEPDAIGAALDAWLGAADVGAVLTTGGTGIGARDTTIEVVRDRLTAELEGFGELFRMVSFREIGAAAMLSRAVAGLVARAPAAGGDTFVFAMPGSPHAVATALDTLILPELTHLVGQREGSRGAGPQS